MYLSSSTGFDPLEKTSLIVPALNTHDYRHRFSTGIIAVTAAKSRTRRKLNDMLAAAADHRSNCWFPARNRSVAVESHNSRTGAYQVADLFTTLTRLRS
jgi:hypothetical protein